MHIYANGEDIDENFCKRDRACNLFTTTGCQVGAVEYDSLAFKTYLTHDENAFNYCNSDDFCYLDNTMHECRTNVEMDRIDLFSHRMRENIWSKWASEKEAPFPLLILGVLLLIAGLASLTFFVFISKDKTIYYNILVTCVPI